MANEGTFKIHCRPEWKDVSLSKETGISSFKKVAHFSASFRAGCAHFSCGAGCCSQPNLHARPFTNRGINLFKFSKKFGCPNVLKSVISHSQKFPWGQTVTQSSGLGWRREVKEVD